ncbi:MAG: 50S ribosomal protein L35 [Aquificota bacterium]|nr:50S ribosomal protein L35 [Aquificota bacterium]
MAKVKMKTNRSARKRFKITATGKIKRRKSGGAHYNTKKSSSRKRRLRQATTVKANMEDHIRGLLKEF